VAKELPLIITGASTRAAAFSALRAGFRPWCADLFADADLRRRCPVSAVPGRQYPHGLPAVLRAAPPGPWMFTGGLENHPDVVAAVSRDRPIWGNSAEVLRFVRDPVEVARVLATAGVPVPEIQADEAELDRGRPWLIKPRAGAGGTGIRHWRPVQRPPRHRVYFQEFLEGPSWSAVYVGSDDSVQWLGASHQLVGEPWLNAKPFHYCGSICSHATVTPVLEGYFREIGEAVSRAFQLRGLFGVDCIMREGKPMPVEVNPRYTASVEVVEFSRGLPALAAHGAAFGVFADRKSPGALGVVGKAILFARRKFRFPESGPWLEVLNDPPPVDALPPFADIPAAEQKIELGAPIVTLFAQADSAVECRKQLQRGAAELDRWLYGK
jgi:predicted ATP-grasp superfamily ATP-dependent carboligase